MFFLSRLFAVQLQEAAYTLDNGLSECTSINHRLATANAEALGLKDKLNAASRAALTSASAGFAELNAGSTGLKTAAIEALKLNKDATGLASQVTNTSSDAAQVIRVISFLCLWFFFS